MRLRRSLLTAAIMLTSPTLVSAASEQWNRLDFAAVKRAAERENKAAQLELGDRYRTGIDGHRDLSKARRWYRRAARDVFRSTSVYSAPVGKESYGRAIRTGSTLLVPGLPEAKSRLSLISPKISD